MKKVIKIGLALIFTILLLVFIVPTSNMRELTFTIPNFVIGGGNVRSSNSNFDATGTIGQPSTIRLSNNDFEISSGFWNEPRELVPQRTLSIILTGDGSGSIISKPHGIDCGERCSFNFNVNSQVKLIALEADGSKFGGWTEHCKHQTTCAIQIEQSKNITATFNKIAETTSRQFLPFVVR